MAAMWCAELPQGYKKPVRFYTTPVWLLRLYVRGRVYCKALLCGLPFNG